MAAYEDQLLRGVAAVCSAVAKTVEVTAVAAATSHKSGLQTSNFVGRNNARPQGSGRIMSPIGHKRTFG